MYLILNGADGCPDFFCRRGAQDRKKMWDSSRPTKFTRKQQVGPVVSSHEKTPGRERVSRTLPVSLGFSLQNRLSLLFLVLFLFRGSLVLCRLLLLRFVFFLLPFGVAHDQAPFLFGSTTVNTLPKIPFS